MTDNFIRDRISELRLKKGVSEYKMSMDLGHSRSYIQSISSGKALPSMTEFLYICEYLGVTPAEFFDGSIREPTLANMLYNLAKDMSEQDIVALISIAQRLNSQSAK